MTKPALITVRVAARRIEALDIVSLDLVPEDGSALPAFAAGAHIDVHLPGGLVRPYSLCNPPGEEGCYQIAVLRDPASRGGSQAVHAHLEVGTALAISPPRNHFPLDVQAPFHLLLAGGIGITPLWAMAKRFPKPGSPLSCTFAPVRGHARHSSTPWPAPPLQPRCSTITMTASRRRSWTSPPPSARHPLARICMCAARKGSSMPCCKRLGMRVGPKIAYTANTLAPPRRPAPTKGLLNSSWPALAA